jgi:phytoene synthase
MPLDPHFTTQGAPPGSMRWHALLYSQAASRDRVAAAFALEAELREIASGSLDHGVAHAKLGWWREEALRLADGRPRHPITRALTGSCASPAAVSRSLDAALGAAEIELAQVVPQDEAEFEQYLDGAGGALACLALGATGPADASTAFASPCGRAIRCVEILRDLRRDAWRGRVFLPWAWVEEAGLDLDELRGDTSDDRTLTLFRRVAALGRRLREESGAAAAGRLPDDWRPLHVLAELHFAVLSRIERAGFAVGREPVELQPLSRLLIAWRAARRA